MKVISIISSTSDVDKEDICHGGGWYFGQKYVGLFPPLGIITRERDYFLLFTNWIRNYRYPVLHFIETCEDTP